MTYSEIPLTLDCLNSTNAFLDDIILITEGQLEKREEDIEKKTLHCLDEENLAINLHKCELGLTEIVWLVYKVN